MWNRFSHNQTWPNWRKMDNWVFVCHSISVVHHISGWHERLRRKAAMAESTRLPLNKCHMDLTWYLIFWHCPSTCRLESSKFQCRTTTHILHTYASILLVACFCFVNSLKWYGQVVMPTGICLDKQSIYWSIVSKDLHNNDTKPRLCCKYIWTVIWRFGTSKGRTVKHL